MTIRLAICDDNASYRKVLTLIIGMENDIEIVGEAGDGEAGIMLAAAHEPDVMLLDVAMPLMDGIEAIPSILERSPRTVVIMLTGFSSHLVRDRALAAGAWRFIEKGTDVGEITRTVREAAGVHA
ncbi:MAG: response regulator transcription factor [Thermoleophilia bacterium]|nr:response regulator transcription factor [Thermoleophilia bacterium]